MRACIVVFVLVEIYVLWNYILSICEARVSKNSIPKAAILAKELLLALTGQDSQPTDNGQRVYKNIQMGHGPIQC